MRRTASALLHPPTLPLAGGSTARRPPRRSVARCGPTLPTYATTTLRVDTGVGSDADARPRQEVSLHNVTAQVREAVAASGVQEGTVFLLSKHTTVALTINEDESRLREDFAAWLLKLAPPARPYLHNDLDERPASAADRAAIERNWVDKGMGTLEEFMAQEPVNAHAHLLASLLGCTESVPVVGGELCLGQWQSIMMVELDGPRQRSVVCQVTGLR